MDRNNAKDYLPLVQALADGKVIQLHGVKGWNDYGPDISFSHHPDCYRIKPEPLELSLFIGQNGEVRPFGESYPSPEIMKQHGYRLVRMREIM